MDLRKFRKQLLSEKAWRKNNRNAITIFKTGNVRVLLIALRAGAELHTDITRNTLLFHVLKGRLNIKFPDKKETIRKGKMLAIHEKTDYVVSSGNKAIFLLTVVE